MKMLHSCYDTQIILKYFRNVIMMLKLYYDIVNMSLLPEFLGFKKKKKGLGMRN
jgi:FtsH-binding integral membrane protein